MKMRWMISAILSMALWGGANIAHAFDVIYSNTYDSGSNTWTYDASVTNDSTDLLYDFVIFPTVQPLSGADLSAVGWGAADMGSIAPNYFVHWLSDFGSEILPGDTLGGFSFIYSGNSAEDIGGLAYTLTLWDTLTDSPYTADGITQVAVVPEPEIAWLLGSGLLMLLGAARRRESGRRL